MRIPSELIIQVRALARDCRTKNARLKSFKVTRAEAVMLIYDHIIKAWGADKNRAWQEALMQVDGPELIYLCGIRLKWERSKLPANILAA